MRYIEYENVIYRTEGPPGYPMDEKAVGGKWVEAGGRSSLDAALYGMRMDESEAREFAGEDWPGAEAQDSNAAAPERE
jgi:hypothetical protein